MVNAVWAYPEMITGRIIRQLENSSAVSMGCLSMWVGDGSQQKKQKGCCRSNSLK